MVKDDGLPIMLTFGISYHACTLFLYLTGCMYLGKSALLVNEWNYVHWFDGDHIKGVLVVSELNVLPVDVLQVVLLLLHLEDMLDKELLQVLISKVNAQLLKAAEKTGRSDMKTMMMVEEFHSHLKFSHLIQNCLQAKKVKKTIAIWLQNNQIAGQVLSTLNTVQLKITHAKRKKTSKLKKNLQQKKASIYRGHYKVLNTFWAHLLLLWIVIQRGVEKRSIIHPFVFWIDNELQL